MFLLLIVDAAKKSEQISSNLRQNSFYSSRASSNSNTIISKSLDFQINFLVSIIAEPVDALSSYVY